MFLSDRHVISAVVSLLLSHLTTMETLPDNALRSIRNIQFDASDLRVLLQGSTARVGSTILNAFAALVQDVADHSTSRPRDFIFFSSWISALTSDENPNGTLLGTVLEHVQVAVSTFCSDILLLVLIWYLLRPVFSVVMGIWATCTDVHDGLCRYVAEVPPTGSWDGSISCVVSSA